MSKRWYDISPSEFPRYTDSSDHTRMDNKEQALAWLDKPVQEHTGFVFVVKVHPNYDRLRDDPRYTA